MEWWECEYLYFTSEACVEGGDEGARQQQDLFASTQGDVANNLVQIYRSLGGGWAIRQGRDPVESLPESMKDEMRERTKQWKGVLE